MMIAYQFYQAIKSLKNVQVVFDEYENDELLLREGFDFETMELQHEQIRFYKNNEFVQILEFSLYTSFQVLPDYENYFALYHGKKRTELYLE